MVLGAMHSCEVQFVCRRAVFVCFYASGITGLVGESAANRLLILLHGGCAEDSEGLFLAQVCGALEGNSMEGT